MYTADIFCVYYKKGFTFLVIWYIIAVTVVNTVCGRLISHHRHPLLSIIYGKKRTVHV